MAILSLVLGLVAFILATLEVEVLGAGVQQLISAGLAFVALALLLGSLPRAPRA